MFKNIFEDTLDVLFVLPITGTVTSCTAKIGYNRRMRTQIIPNSLLDDYQNENKTKEKGKSIEYIPNLYRLPINNLKPGEELHVKIQYMEHLKWSDGRFRFTLPLQFHEGSITQGSFEEIVSVSVAVLSLKEKAHIECSYELTKELFKNETLTCSFGRVLDPKTQQPRDSADFGDYVGLDFEFSYKFNNNNICGMVLYEENNKRSPSAAQSGGDFVVFLAPPAKRS
eukprot:UN30845